jgi:hypothetical protein
LTMRDIKRRLERLEQATMPDEDRECLVILCKSWSSGRLTALMLNRGTDDELRLLRIETETEQEFYDRAEAKMKEMRPSRIDGGKAVYMMTEIRENIERPEDWWRADPMGTGNPDLAKQDTREVEPVVPDPVVKPGPRTGSELSPAPRPASRELVQAKRKYGPRIQQWMMG